MARSPTTAPRPAAPPAPRKPFGLWVHGRYDTTGAVRSVLSIVSALGWRQSAEILEVLGEVGPEQQKAAYGLGGTVAAVLMG